MDWTRRREMLETGGKDGNAPPRLRLEARQHIALGLIGGSRERGQEHQMRKVLADHLLPVTASSRLTCFFGHITGELVFVEIGRLRLLVCERAVILGCTLAATSRQSNSQLF